MKWKKYYKESHMGDSDSSQARFILKDVDEITPDSDSWGSYASDAQFLIDEYLGKQAKAYYTNGHIPEDEEEEWRECLKAVLVEFEYWCDEDEEYEAGYDDGKILFIIDKRDGEVEEYDEFSNDYPEDIFEKAKAKAIEYVKSSNN